MEQLKIQQAKAKDSHRQHVQEGKSAWVAIHLNYTKDGTAGYDFCRVFVCFLLAFFVLESLAVFWFWLAGVFLQLYICLKRILECR